MFGIIEAMILGPAIGIAGGFASGIYKHVSARKAQKKRRAAALQYDKRPYMECAEELRRAKADGMLYGMPAKYIGQLVSLIADLTHNKADKRAICMEINHLRGALAFDGFNDPIIDQYLSEAAARLNR